MKLSNKLKLWLIELGWPVLRLFLSARRYNRLLLTLSFKPVVHPGEYSDTADNIIVKMVSDCLANPTDYNQYNFTPKKILEPSCGFGEILRYLNDRFIFAEIDAVEIDTMAAASSRNVIREVGEISTNKIRLYEGDFLYYGVEFGPKDLKYGLVVMNPPYFTHSVWPAKSKNYTCLHHIIKAHSLLDEYGRMVTLLPEIMLHSIHYEAWAFRSWLQTLEDTGWTVEVQKLGKNVCGYPVSVCMLIIK
jgi:hypothetical protein